MEHYLCRRCSFYYRKNNNIAISSFISKMQSKNTLTQKIRNMFFIITKNQEEFIRQSNLFDPIFYIKHNYDAAIDNTDPLHHYMTIGAKRGSNPNEWFDSNRYLARNPDVQDYCMNPFYHYLRYGIKENRDL